MRYFIALGCSIGFVAMCILGLVHVLYEMWQHGPYSASDPSTPTGERRHSREICARPSDEAVT